MNFDFFMKVNQFRVSFGQFASAEDFADCVNYMITPIILICFAGLSASKQYIFSPIQCWSIKETDSSPRMDYIENLCWIENMYYWPLHEDLPKMSQVQRDQKRLYYYQWVPFVLGLQALLFYLPRVCWLFLSNRFGTSVMDIIRFSMSAATVEQDKRQKLVSFLASHIEKSLYNAQPYRSGRWATIKSKCAQLLPCLFLTKRTGFMLVGSYLLVKLLYVQNAVLQLAIMQEFLGMNSSYWGATLLDNVLSRRTWDQTGIFPRVVRCDIVIDYGFSTNKFHAQCVLPNNMMNEKIYIFLWLWTWGTLLLTALSFMSWAVSSALRSSRRTYLKKYLKILSHIHSEDKTLARKFMNNFLRHDGVFILRMVSSNAGDMITAEIVREIWMRYRVKKADFCDPELPLLPPERPPRGSSGQQQQQQQQQQQRNQHLRRQQQQQQHQQVKANFPASSGSSASCRQQAEQQNEDSASYV